MDSHCTGGYQHALSVIYLGELLFWVIDNPLVECDRFLLDFKKAEICMELRK
jgi:hypothetical protein